MAFTSSGSGPGSVSDSGRARVEWRMRLQSALRTTLACAIIGGTTIYGPAVIASQVKFAAFSYLTAVIIIMSDAVTSLGGGLRGCWHAFCATAQVVPLATLARWGLETRAERWEMGIAGAAVVVAAAAFLVALPEGTHLTAKRIAFGQIVVVCSDAVLSEYESAGYMHPAYVAASTALGAVASVVALMIPYPDLACNKIRKLCRVYANNASQRMDLYLRAFGVAESRAKKELLAQAKPLAETGAKLLHSIISLQEGMQWERPWRQYLKTASVLPGDRLQRMELQLRGIEHSLDSTSDLTIDAGDQEAFGDVLKGVSEQVEREIEQIRCFTPFQLLNEAEIRKEEKATLPVEQFHPIVKHGWVFFFFSCIDMILNDDTEMTECRGQHEKAKSSFTGALKNGILKLASKERLEFALKCSLSLGLAVLFGLIFDKRNGCWAGLTIAISFVTGKQAVFTVANTRAQGTAIGSIYGVISCFLFHHEVLKLMALLLWVIFSSILRHSKMYSQSGGISAAIGALLILGRKHYGDPNEFALARVTEVFIGLTTFIAVELCLQPVRAAELAKNHLCTTLSSLTDCIKEIRTCLAQRNQSVPKFHELRDKQRNLNSQVSKLKKAVEDAELEPDFWYLPFRASCYRKLAKSLAKSSDMLYFITHNHALLLELSESGDALKEFHQQIARELELCQETISTSLEYLQKAQSTKSQHDSQQHDDQRNDIEMGKLQNQDNQSNLIAEHAAAKIENGGCKDDSKHGEMTIQCVSTTAFCISALAKEIDEIDINTREIQ